MMSKRKAEHIPARLIEFQPDHIELEQQPVPGPARITLYVLLAMVVVALLWATFAQMDRVVTATGKIIPVGQAIVVQPLLTSVVKNISVDIGQVVKAGQVLVTLDPTLTRADLAQVQSQVDSLSVQVKRLEAEYAGIPFIAGRISPASAQQAKVYSERQAEFKARMDVLTQNAARMKAEISSDLQERERLKERLAVIAELEGMRQKLQEARMESRVNLLEAQNRRMTLSSELQRLESKGVESRHALASLEAEKTVLARNWRSNIARELADTRREYERLSEQTTKAGHLNNLIELKAPQDAVVLEVASRTTGSVVKEAEPILTLVPLNVQLEAEVEIGARDIGLVRAGDHVQVKLETFPFEQHGTVSGKLRMIAGDAFQNKTAAGNVLTYRARITLDKPDLHGVPKDFHLIPGMALTAEVKVGKRSVISYFLYPLKRATAEAMREP